ncbi:hypothetical protein HBI24_070560 [Parastagonospora nodorum]|nr:hypothetical protein HBI48_046190 [Parastagonospora nodorum]KAH5586953.1 hypothetical protein HBI24_070560 [Parastagonospora nodorum]
MACGPRNFHGMIATRVNREAQSRQRTMNSSSIQCRVRSNLVRPPSRSSCLSCYASTVQKAESWYSTLGANAMPTKLHELAIERMWGVAMALSLGRVSRVSMMNTTTGQNNTLTRTHYDYGRLFSQVRLYFFVFAMNWSLVYLPALPQESVLLMTPLARDV